MRIITFVGLCLVTSGLLVVTVTMCCVRDYGPSDIVSIMDSCVIVCIGEFGHGSGVVLENGVVVTACHCADTNLPLTVVQDGVIFEVEEIILSECWDTAILIVPGITGGVELASENTISLLDTVYVIGTPWSREFDHNVTVGLFCDFDVDWEYWIDAYRVSADAGPGNSGGGVFDIHGHLVGIVVAGPDPGSGVTVVEPVKHFEELLNGRAR